MIERSEVLENLRPAMYWASTMALEVQSVARGDYSGHTNRTNRKLKYKEEMLNLWGEDVVNKLANLNDLKFSEYCELMQWVYDECQQLWRDGSKLMTPGIEDVYFWVGEVKMTLDRTRTLIIALGRYDVDSIMQELAMEHLGVNRC